MNRFRTVFHKLATVLSFLSVTINIAQPALFALYFVTPAYAEEVVTESPTPDSSVQPSPSPEESVLPSPEESLVPTSEPTTEISPSPSPEIILEPSLNPSPSLEPIVQPTPSPTQEVSNPEPTQDSSPAPPSPTESVLPSTTPTPTPELLNENLTIKILEHSDATSIDEFDLAVNETGSATLITDKPDYAPTDTALISGSGFLPNTSYSLTISSTDEPATSTTITVTTDENGTLFYAYQLDGIYRPNYKVEAYLAKTIVASVTFTDSYVVGNYTCENDAQGANDEPGQKDLNLMCSDESNLPNNLLTKWNWDETGWSGNNSGDACNLFDTDGDGRANYSLCVVINGSPATYSSHILYSCTDGKADRCTGPQVLPNTSACAAIVNSTDPFSGNGKDRGDQYPNDTQGSCSIKLTDISSTNAELIDVCSYPSQQPNSDPSDCIIAATTQDRGTITVIKDLYPANDTGKFNLQIDGENFATNVGDGGSTGAIQFAVGSHSVGEVAYSGSDLVNYSTGINCVSGNVSKGTTNNYGPLNISLAKNENIVCTITNTRINNATLTIVKDANPNDPQDFSFTITGTGLANFILDDDSDPTRSNTITFSDLAAGTYGVSESAISGWDLTSATCTDGSLVSSINLSAGENVTCTFTNTKKSHLIVQKTTQPSGDLTSFTISATGSGTITNGGSGTVSDSLDKDYELTPGTYNVSETVPAGWTKTIDTCQSVSVAAGETKYCQLTNVKNGTIIVEKDMVGGTDSFGFTGTLAGTISSDNGQLTLAVSPGTYASTEEAKTGWQLDSIVCNDNTNGGTASTGNTPTRTATFNVDAGETVKCTFTNTKLGTIITEKQTLPDGDSAIFSFTPSYGSNFNLSDGQTNTSSYLTPGTYSIVENQLSGWTQTSSSCSDQSNPSSISLSAGETVTCTFINTKHGSIAGIKYNDLNGDGNWDAGEPVASGWLISLLDSNDNVIATDTTDVNGEYSFANLLPVLYSLVETMQDGWLQTGSPSSITLSAGQNSDDNNFFNFQKINVSGQKFNDLDGDGVKEAGEPGIANWTIYLSNGTTTTSTTSDSNGNYQFAGLTPGSYTVSEDTSVAGWSQTYPVGSTYTFEAISGTNKTGLDFGNHAKGKITLIKSVTNDDGGQAGVNDFGLSIGGVPVNSGTTLTLPAFNSYSLNEVGLPGYSFVSLTGDQKCPSVLGDSVSLAPNDDITCTITNNDLAPSLKLVKNVTANNGGNETAASWTLTATGVGGFSDLGNSTTFHYVKAGVGYILSESNLPGYSASSWSCDGGSLVGSTVTLDLNQQVTCQITNDDLAPSLTVIKHVINDNGGNATVTDFDIEINDLNLSFDSGVINTTTTSYTATPSVTANILYTLSELDLPGYAEGDFSCYDNNTQQVVAHPVTFSEGQSITCEISNDDIAPKLTLIKNVINDNGGTQQPDDFSLTVAGVGVSSGFKNTYNANTALSLNETQLSGYSFVSITGSAKCPSVLGGTITLDEGEDLTCTITNNDQPGTLTVTKVTLPTDTQTEFSITATGSGAISGSNVRTIQDGTPVNYTVDAGTYTVTEAVVPGWDETENTCKDVVVTNGGSSNCTITNTKRGHLIVQKTTIPAADPNSFSITATGSGTITGSASATISDSLDHDYEVTPGTYSVSETVHGNWDQTSNTCIDVVVGAGETKYCEITNTKRGHVTVIKYNDHNGNGVQDDGDETLNNWEIKLDKMAQWTGSQVTGQVTFSDLTPATYNLSETNQSGWVQTNISCTSDTTSTIDADNSHSVVVNPGATTICKIGNFKLGKIYGYKYEDRNGNGNWDEGESTLSNWLIKLGSLTDTTDENGYFEFNGLSVGNYTLTEDETNTDYKRTEPTSSSYAISITSGTGYNQEDNYLFGNAPLTDIHGYKWNDQNGNGRRDCDTLSELRLLDQLDGCEYSEELLGGWTIFIDKNSNNILDEGEESTTTDNNPESDHYGWYWFYNLFPGNYRLCEVLKQGWEQTYPLLLNDVLCHTITVPNDSEQTENAIVGPEYNFGNQAEPKLRIQKSNDATSNKNPGDIVTYKLVVDLTGSSLSLVKVTDVTPEGFDYVPGSYTATLNGSPLSITEPNYASPGIWELGDMSDGDQIVLTYQAKIASNQDGGTYNDIAWAEGGSKGWGTVLAQGHDSEYVDDIFVGTDVVINKNSDQTGSVDIETEGEVLGAATELPATGANTLWLVLAITSLISGLALIFGGKSMKKISLALFTVLSLSLASQPVHAADPDNNLSIRLEQPQSPTRIQDWKLSFSTLDRLARTPVVTCYVKKPGSASFVQFDGNKISSKTTGDNNYCQVNSSVMSSQGTYEFYALVVAGSDSENSSTATVVYDTEGPGKPTSYSKDHPSLCRWVIKFHTADDNGLTQKVEIYSSDSTNFNTDNGTRVGTVTIGSNQEGSYTHDRANNCDKTYYYVIRAYDSAGNQSAHIGDEVVTINSASSTASSAAPAIIVTQNNGVVLGQGDDSQDPSEGEAASDSGEVMGENAEIVETNAGGILSELKNSNNKWWYVAAGLFAIVVIAYVIRHKKTS